MNTIIYFMIIISLIVLGIVIYKYKKSTQIEGFESNQETVVVDIDLDHNDNLIKPDCTEVYYPRYRGWYRYVWDIKTRPEYNRIYPPYWNTEVKMPHNDTSDIYYEKLAKKGILPDRRLTPFILENKDEIFDQRQQIKFH